MNTELTTTPTTYSTLEEIRLRKEQLSDAINKDGEQIGTMWNQLFTKREDSSKGEYIAALVTNSITAVDAFLMVRKLMKRYGGLASLFSSKTSKSNKKKKQGFF